MNALASIGLAVLSAPGVAWALAILYGRVTATTECIVAMGWIVPRMLLILGPIGLIVAAMGIFVSRAGFASIPRIGRASFLVRLVGLVAVSLLVYVTLHMYVPLADSLPRNERSAQILSLLASYILVGLVVLIVSFRSMILPRLSDIGLYGTFRTLVSLLWFVPVVGGVLLLVLIFTPPDFVPR